MQRCTNPGLHIIVLERRQSVVPNATGCPGMEIYEIGNSASSIQQKTCSLAKRCGCSEPRVLRVANRCFSGFDNISKIKKTLRSKDTKYVFVSDRCIDVDKLPHFTSNELPRR
jgi:hypothetical protein